MWTVYLGVVDKNKIIKVYPFWDDYVSTELKATKIAKRLADSLDWDGKLEDGGEIPDFAEFQQTPGYKKIAAEAKEIENDLWPGLDNDKVQELSVAFSDVINNWCTTDELAEINRRNKIPEYGNSCATHDFYDANMAMNEAFEKVFKREYVFFNDEIPGTEEQNEIDTAYENAAWDLSKDSQFKNTSANA